MSLQGHLAALTAVPAEHHWATSLQMPAPSLLALGGMPQCHASPGLLQGICLTFLAHIEVPIPISGQSNVASHPHAGREQHARLCMHAVFYPGRLQLQGLGYAPSGLRVR